MAQKYLYGASVQGIQEFIFETNKLKDIVGASSLVESICTSMFDEFATEGESVVRAAGNIKHVFSTEAACRRAVRDFTRKVMVNAPGITISQAVVEFDETSPFAAAVDKLESKLRTARNRPIVPVELGLMAIERSRNTGKPAVKADGKEYLDAGTACKRSERNVTRKLSIKAFGDDTIRDELLPFNIEDITDSNSWVAIIHADGNGLGKIVQRIGADKDVFATFSRTLDLATQKAAVEAYEKWVAPEFVNRIVPMRPIVLGGDDFTAIIRGDLAIGFANEFLKAFEKRTRSLFKSEIADKYSSRLSQEQKEILEKGLTACAGIAFVKESYPFYYGYQLAEELCGEAKKAAKKINENLAPSCLMFHKVQDSFVSGYAHIKERELTPCPSLSYVFGPYYATQQTGKWDTDTLVGYALKFSGEEGNAIKSSLRKWMSIIAESGTEAARQYADRIKELNPNMRSPLGNLLDCDSGATPVYDILSLSSIIHIKTK